MYIYICIYICIYMYIYIYVYVYIYICIYIYSMQSFINLKSVATLGDGFSSPIHIIPVISSYGYIYIYISYSYIISYIISYITSYIQSVIKVISPDFPIISHKQSFESSHRLASKCRKQGLRFGLCKSGTSGPRGQKQKTQINFHVYIYMYVCMYLSMYLCIYVSMYLCIYVCM